MEDTKNPQEQEENALQADTNSPLEENVTGVPGAQVASKKESAFTAAVRRRTIAFLDDFLRKATPTVERMEAAILAADSVAQKALSHRFRRVSARGLRALVSKADQWKKRLDGTLPPDPNYDPDLARKKRRKRTLLLLLLLLLLISSCTYIRYNVLQGSVSTSFELNDDMQRLLEDDGLTAGGTIESAETSDTTGSQSSSDDIAPSEEVPASAPSNNASGDEGGAAGGGGEVRYVSGGVRYITVDSGNGAGSSAANSASSSTIDPTRNLPVRRSSSSARSSRSSSRSSANNYFYGYPFYSGVPSGSQASSTQSSTSSSVSSTLSSSTSSQSSSTSNSSNSSSSSSNSSDESVLALSLRSRTGRIIRPTYHFEKGTAKLVVDEREFTPGFYTLRMTRTNLRTGIATTAEQEFPWGVLAMNTDKDRYLPGERAHIDFGVLDENGAIVCDASLSLTITAPNGSKTVLSTTNGGIAKTGTCGLKTAGLLSPDYEGNFGLTQVGAYALELRATRPGGGAHSVSTLSSTVQVVAAPPYIIKRTAATRLWPFAPSTMTVEVEFLSNFSGTITDIVPGSFEVSSVIPSGSISADTQSPSDTAISWSGSWLAGQTATFQYTYDAPDISPEFFLIGPLRFSNQAGTVLGEELRSWQIANDPGTLIVNMPSGRSAHRTTNGDDVTVVGQVGQHMIRVRVGSVLITEAPIVFDVNDNRDWSGETFVTNVTQLNAIPSIPKSAIHFTENSGHAAGQTHTLFVPKGTTTEFRVCPNATSLADVTSSCTGGVLFSGSFPQSATVGGDTVEVGTMQSGGTTYWYASGLSGSGGMGDSPEMGGGGGGGDVPDMGVISMLVIAAGGSTFMMRGKVPRFKKVLRA